jgi:beta-phosphoglucomutase
MNNISGRGSRDGITKYLSLKGVRDYSIDELSKRFDDIKRGLIMENLEEEVYIIPGLEAFLEYLKNNSKRILVVTSSHYEYVKHILEHFNLFGYFEKVYDRTSVINGKPNPDIFLNAIKYTGLDTSECIAFEDSLFGLQSSKSAGLFTVGILNKGWNDDFVYDLADTVISSYDELLN